MIVRYAIAALDSKPCHMRKCSKTKDVLLVFVRKRKKGCAPEVECFVAVDLHAFGLNTLRHVL